MFFGVHNQINPIAVAMKAETAKLNNHIETYTLLMVMWFSSSNCDFVFINN